MDRDPCPDRILTDAGVGFAIGAVGGTLMNLYKGAVNAPRGDRLAGGFQHIRMDAPRIAGRFAVWSALFSTFDCGLVFARQKEDPWNSILAGAAAGGLLSFRRGFRHSAYSALGSGALMALFEGINLVWVRVEDARIHRAQLESVGYGEQAEVGAAEEAEGWLRGLLGRWKKQGSDDDGRRSESETKILESYDSPTPMPNFEIN